MAATLTVEQEQVSDYLSSRIEYIVPKNCFNRSRRHLETIDRDLFFTSIPTSRTCLQPRNINIARFSGADPLNLPDDFQRK